MNQNDLLKHDACLPAAARLDRCWAEARAAATEDVLLPAAVTPLASGNFFRARLQPHAAARWTWFVDASAYAIWARNHGNDAAENGLDPRAEGALLTCPRGTVQWRSLTRAGCAFLDACATGCTVADAARAALDIDSSTDLGCLLTTLLEAGAFSRLHMET